MKVLHLISHFGGGGLERRAIQTVKGLCVQPDVEQRIIVYSEKIEYNEVLTLGVDIHYLKHFDKAGKYKEIKAFIADFKPDIIHSWLDRFPTEHVMLSIMKYRFGYKYIHGAVCDGNRLPIFSTIWFAQKVSFAFADAIVSNSKAGLEAKGAPTSKSVVIYNGFDFGRIPDHLDESKKTQLGVKSKYMICMCGRVDGSKDWTSYIEVARLTKEAGLDATFIAIGNGNLIGKFREEAKMKGADNVFFTGRRTDVEELIGLSDVCMLLSDTKNHAEGVSNFIMEAMASRKPVIATRGGGTPEIISDGVNGVVVDDNVIEAFEQLKKVLSDDNLRLNYGERAKEEIQKRFSLDLMTKNYMSLYKRLLKQ